MKKALFIGLLMVGGILLTSCKKDWTCECQYYGEVESYIIYNKTKSQAKKQCTGQTNIGWVPIEGDANCSVR